MKLKIFVSSLLKINVCKPNKINKLVKHFLELVFKFLEVQGVKLEPGIKEGAAVECRSPEDRVATTRLVSCWGEPLLFDGCYGMGWLLLENCYG